jgi:FKBP-type peptidyl-prolyl cis-trans isomerase
MQMRAGLVAAAILLAACGEDTPATPTPSFDYNAQDLVVGTGNPAVAGDSLTVNYIGTLDDGRVFDDSYARGEPFTFQLGAGTVIRGWDRGLVGMRVGGKRRLVISPTYGYGSQPAGTIPPNSTLHFDVELIALNGVS